MHPAMTLLTDVSSCVPPPDLQFVAQAHSTHRGDHIGCVPVDITAFATFIGPQNNTVIVDMGCDEGLLSKAILEWTDGTAKLTCVDIT